MARRRQCRSLFTLGSTLALGLMLIACDQKKEPQPQPTPSPTEKVAPSQPKPQARDSKATAEAQTDLSWQVPDGWKEMPPRMMRKATYEVPGKDGNAEVGVFYFGPGQGGGVEANIERWVGQFSSMAEGAEKRSEEEINGLKRFNVEVKNGTYKSGMPGAPATSVENWALSASIVETPVGHYYFKMTGPAATVAEQNEKFRKMLSSITTKSEQ